VTKPAGPLTSVWHSICCSSLAVEQHSLVLLPESTTTQGMTHMGVAILRG
jgi:hypothetical protein